MNYLLTDEEFKWCCDRAAILTQKYLASPRSSITPVSVTNVENRERVKAIAEIGIARILNIEPVELAYRDQVGHLEHGLMVRPILNEAHSLVFSDTDKQGKVYVLAYIIGRQVNAKGWARWNEETKAKCQLKEKYYQLQNIHLNTIQDMFNRLRLLRTQCGVE